MDYYQSKLDLESYSTRDLDILANFYDINSDNRQDLLWLLAIANLSGSQHAQMIPGKAWERYGGDLLERFKSDRTAPEDATAIPKEMIDADFTPNKKHLEWIVKSYLDGGIKLFEDMPRVNVALREYNHLLAKRLIIDKQYLNINIFCGIAGCTIKGKEKEGLEDFLDHNKDKLSTFRKTKERQIAETDIERFYEDGDVSIVIPKTEEASCKYGGGTRWCTAARGENLFETYNKKGPLYILIPKKPKYDGEKYQIHVETDSVMNDKDESIGILTLRGIYPGIKSIVQFKTLPTVVDNIEDLKGIDRDITNIKFGDNFNQPVDDLPEWVTHLTFKSMSKFNQPLDKLPKGLTHLTFGGAFNQPVDKLPEGMTHLTFGGDFNRSVDNLPKKLTHLTFGFNFNKPVENLPTGLVYLTFEARFNQSVDELPKGLNHLTFGGDFNHPVDNLPENLTHLTFGYNFNQPVENLPEQLIHLTFGGNFNQPVEKLPERLTHLTFGLTSKFNQPVDHLPRELTQLIFGERFNHSVDDLPALTHLTFGFDFNQPVDKLPEGLTYLKFSWHFNQPVDNLPKKLTQLSFGIDFNQLVDKLPEELTRLVLGSQFNQSIANLPYKLTHLTIGRAFNKQVPTRLARLLSTF